eukprot:TRINITY_DN11644_c0_g1_i1.p1 TRINITY_DN11644_c0_g1~~TRINITY_DN11644_c0_g1_i1.p1  ORF type:complete len:130 (-),score=15.58 TRINITY_DN11644_c0_g1_i1:3-392(-)
MKLIWCLIIPIKGRAFLRFALNEKVLADVCSAIVKDENLVKSHYEEISILRRPDDASIFIQQLNHLKAIDFRFSLNQSDREKYAHGQTQTVVQNTTSSTTVSTTNNKNISDVPSTVSYTHLTLPTKRIV